MRMVAASLDASFRNVQYTVEKNTRVGGRGGGVIQHGPTGTISSLVHCGTVLWCAGIGQEFARYCS